MLCAWGPCRKIQNRSLAESKSAPVSQTFFIAGKNEGNFAGQKHLRSSLNNFMSSFASMILIHVFFRPIRFFHNHHRHNLSISFIYVCLIGKRSLNATSSGRDLKRALSIRRFRCRCAHLGPAPSRQQIWKKKTRGLCYATFATFCLQVVGDFNAVLRAPRESEKIEKSICWEFLRTVSTAHAWVVAAV